MVPALKALHLQWPSAKLHVLVREEAVPVLENIPWITKVWGIPKNLNLLKFRSLWKTLFELRRHRFERSVDFEGNDRGAVLSLLIGAKERLGSMASRGFAGRRHCYTDKIQKAPNGTHEVYRDLHTLEAWNVLPPPSLDAEVRPDPRLAGFAESLLPVRGAVLAHLSTSQQKKEWPIKFWAEIAHRAARARIPLFFSSGISPREQSLLAELKERAPDASLLSQCPNLASFIAVIHRAGVFVSGDTGPLHLAAGLGVPSIGIFGPSDINQWLPMVASCTGLSGSKCTCSGHAQVCGRQLPCIQGVTVDALWEQIGKLYARSSDSR